VPIFNAGVMGELNKALGARKLGKSTSSEKEEGAKKDSGDAAKAPEPEPSPALPMPVLKPVAHKPKPAAMKEKEEAAGEPDIPPWKLELQRRKKTASISSPPPQFKKPADEGAANNELAAILARRKQKSGG